MKALAAMLLLFAAIKATAGEPILVDAKIKDQPVRLIFDTGASDTALIRKTAELLHLHITEPSADLKSTPGHLYLGASEICTMELFGSKTNISLPVFDTLPNIFPNCGGVLGWSFISKNIVWIDSKNNKVAFLHKVPEHARGWTKIPVRPYDVGLFFEINETNGSTIAIHVDTGEFDGVRFPPRMWRRWRSAHQNASITLEAVYRPDSGLEVVEEAFSKSLAFGPLRLTNVLIIEGGVADAVASMESHYEASIGMDALKYLDIIVDGPSGVAYIHDNGVVSGSYDYNRLGAVFAPKDPNLDDLVATVTDESPAFKAGIRNGDLLQRIDELDVTKWRTNPAVLPLSRFWGRPAGTQFHLALKRGGETKVIKITLQDVLTSEAR